MGVYVGGFLGNQVENWVEHTQFEEKNPVCSLKQEEKILPLFLKLLEMDIYHQQRNEACGVLLSILGVYLDIFPVEYVGRSDEDEKRMEMAVLLIKKSLPQIRISYTEGCVRC